MRHLACLVVLLGMPLSGLKSPWPRGHATTVAWVMPRMNKNPSLTHEVTAEQAFFNHNSAHKDYLSPGRYGLE